MDSRSLRSMGNPGSRSSHRYCRSWRTHRIDPNHRSRRLGIRRSWNSDVRTRRRSGRTSRETPWCRAGRSGRRWSWWICQPQPGRREFRDPRGCDPSSLPGRSSLRAGEPNGPEPTPSRAAPWPRSPSSRPRRPCRGSTVRECRNNREPAAHPGRHRDDPWEGRSSGSPACRSCGRSRSRGRDTSRPGRASSSH